jgi:peptidyl-prolyl cis-trans isomerase B (cyclophilin B)
MSAADQQIVDSIQQGDQINSVSIKGDSEDLLASLADRVSEWNEAINRDFPDL